MSRRKQPFVSHLSVTRDGPRRCDVCREWETSDCNEWGLTYRECRCGRTFDERRPPPAAERDPVLAVVSPAVAPQPQRRAPPNEQMRRVISWAGSNRRGDA